MKHEEIKKELSAYFDGQLGPEKAVEISAHVSACAECRAALEELSALSNGVKENLSASASPGGKKTAVQDFDPACRGRRHNTGPDGRNRG